MEFREEIDQDKDEEVVEKLVSMFGNVLSHDVIVAVVESCGGDLNQSVEGVMNIAGEASISQPPDASRKSSKSKPKNGAHSPNQKYNHSPRGNADKTKKDKSGHTRQTASQKQPSYAATIQSSGAMPKQMENRPIARPTQNAGSTLWTEQLRQILTYHNQGSRVMVIMRGASGSGKSFLAKQIVELTIGPSFSNYAAHIYSSDQYFLDNRGQYVYDLSRLADAHAWNQQRVRISARDGLSPIVVDNTNIEMWEMEPYVRDAVSNGYIIELMEPNTPWARKAYHLYQRSSHNVPVIKIKRMLDNFHEGLTGESIMKNYKLSYSPPMVPPVLRKQPVITSNEGTSTGSGVTYTAPELMLSPEQKCLHAAAIVQTTTHSVQPTNANTLNANRNSSETNDQLPNLSNLNLSQSYSDNTNNGAAVSKSAQNTSLLIEVNKDTNNDANILPTKENQVCSTELELQKRMEEMQKFELEWENGEHWDSKETAKCENDNLNVPSIEPKPQRSDNADKSKASKTSVEAKAVTKSTPNLMESVNQCQDWREISMFMPPWTDSSPSTSSQAPAIPLETVSSSTCMEIGDTDIFNNNTHKIISATSRDINMFLVSFGSEKIPNKRMLDKSTTTNEQLITEAYRCKNEEKHFIAFRKLFKNIARSSLRDIFDQCCGDVNWAVDIVFDSMANNQIPTVNTEELSDEEEEIFESCACLAAYNIIPDTSTETATNNVQIATEPPEGLLQPPKKAKKETAISDTSLQLKRQIEKNVVIAEDHYSDHCLKIRKMRRGEYNKANENAGPSSVPESFCNASDAAFDQFLIDDDDNSDNEEITPAQDSENFVSVNLGSEFVTQLDNLFGRRDMEYPEGVIPKISIPMSMLNEINALWMESLMHQLEQQFKQSELMIQQDEEFARQLAAKEEEMARAGIEPPVPDFKEIMDMDLALALYQKDVNDWRNHEPNDLAAKLTRDKLYYLFPEVSNDTLAELLAAHDYNFQNTVEVLLISTGREDILARENGINKFVLEKEIERKEKILNEERKALSEADWPFLPKNGQYVDMATVNSYREQAQRHLLRRNLHYNNAKQFIARGMTQVATYYSDIASFHKQRFDFANHLAAASLMQVHASNAKDTETIDLHFMRVNEAKESLDMFIDVHIELLRKSRERGGSRVNNIFIITGRGLHSVGGPRIKPAVKKRLAERGLRYYERNPGLLSAKVCADDKLSYQIP